MKALSDNIKSILSIIIVLASFGLITMLALQHINDKEIVSQILIAVVSSLTGVIGYYYGYSQGASKKDEAQAVLTANSQTTQTTISPAPDTVK